MIIATNMSKYTCSSPGKITPRLFPKVEIHFYSPLLIGLYNAQLMTHRIGQFLPHVKTEIVSYMQNNFVRYEKHFGTFLI
jgi:hypothetical protein